MHRSIPTDAPHLPCGPHIGAIDCAPENVSPKIGDEREDLLPVPSHLSSSVERSSRMSRSLVLVVLRKTRGQGVEIMLVRCPQQALDGGDGPFRILYLARHRRTRRHEATSPRRPVNGSAPSPDASSPGRYPPHNAGSLISIASQYSRTACVRYARK